MNAFDRRDFLKGLGGSFVTSAGAWAALQSVVPARAADARITPDMVRFSLEMEPVVRWIEETPRERVLQKAAEELRRGRTSEHSCCGHQLFEHGLSDVL